MYLKLLFYGIASLVIIGLLCRAHADSTLKKKDISNGMSQRKSDGI